MIRGEMAMKQMGISRSDFLRSAGKICLGTCSCVIGASFLRIQGQTGTEPGEQTAQRAVKRMGFVDTWIKRFMDVIDTSLDEETRKKIMMTNGKLCYQDWIKSQGRKIEPADFDTWAAEITRRTQDGSIRIEGNVVYFQYLGSAETGKPSPESVCLCPMVESKPSGLSSTYCSCSLGYVKEMFELKFDRPVDIELLDSVLLGGQRCRFKITVLDDRRIQQ